MALLNEEFSVETLPQSQGDFSPIPAGWYACRIVKADLTDNKAGTGQYIKLRLDVVGPTHQGRVLWANLNIKNSSSKAEEIGRMQLGTIMTALNISKLTDTDQFIGGEVAVKVEVKDDPTYGPGNEVKAYKGVGDAGEKKPSTGSVTSPETSPAPTSTGKKSPPWAKK